jgi:hypothetical protein
MFILSVLNQNTELPEMNKQSIKALLNSDNFKVNFSRAVHNVFYNGFSVDHVTGKNGYAVLSIRLVNGVMILRDRLGNDITSDYRIATGV